MVNKKISHRFPKKCSICGRVKEYPFITQCEYCDKIICDYCLPAHMEENHNIK